MNWGALRRTKAAATVYLVAFVSLYGGLACVLLAQWTGDPRLALGVVPFLAGVVAIFVLAWVLRDQVPRPPGRFMAKASNHQRAYQRLALGVELARAWQAVRG